MNDLGEGKGKDLCWRKQSTREIELGRGQNPQIRRRCPCVFLASDCQAGPAGASRYDVGT